MTDPFGIGPAIAAGYSGFQLLGGLVDRWGKASQAKLDEGAWLRMCLLEVRYNLAILEVAVGHKQALEANALWHVPVLLRSEILEALMGASKCSSAIRKKLHKTKVGDTQLVTEASGVIPNLYARISALQGLALLHRQAPLGRVKIKLRLEHLYKDLATLRSALTGLTGDI